jgi:hypothetical protein
VTKKVVGVFVRFFVRPSAALAFLSGEDVAAEVLRLLPVALLPGFQLCWYR